MRPATNGTSVDVGATVLGSELEMLAPGTVVSPPLAIVGPVGAGKREPATVVDGLDGLDEPDGFVAADVVVTRAVEEPAKTIVVVVASGEETVMEPVVVDCALTVSATPTTLPLNSKPNMLTRATLKRNGCLVVALGFWFLKLVGVILIGGRPSNDRSAHQPFTPALTRLFGAYLHSCRCLCVSCGFSVETESRNKPLT